MNPKTREKILIVGAGGFVGKVLTQSLVAEGQMPLLALRKKISDFPKLKKYHGDLEDPAFCNKILKNIETVFYLAAFKKNIRFHSEQPFETLAKNVKPFITFLEAAKKSKVKTIMYISSTNAEYALDPDSGIDGYVYGKFVNELIARAFVKETKIAIKILRSAAVYGPGDNFDPKTANFIPSMIRKVDETKGQLEVWGKGNRQLQFIYIHDLVKNIIAAKNSSDDFLTFGNPDIVSVNEVVDKIVKSIGKKLKISHDITKPDKSTKLSTFTNIVKPKTSIDQGLQETIDFYKNHHA
jgi:GDP-L-fucose synthase